jgi:hypothetical protein
VQFDNGEEKECTSNVLKVESALEGKIARNPVDI